ncbi:MAG: hypothetical protein IPK30_11995 [Cellvibrionales bacterium]|nr:hypothetical protein [Cellvibrionales bacterium]
MIGATLSPSSPNGPQTIAEQKGLWSLIYNSDNTFSVRIGNDTVVSQPWKTPHAIKPAPPFHSPAFAITPTAGQQQRTMALYVGGELLDWRQENPAEIDGDFLNPPG